VRAHAREAQSHKMEEAARPLEDSRAASEVGPADS